ncbi:PREDICTED: molybdenum cofactor biosynthesis protein 1-like, partial [Gekko japonicus]|uniref:cyclic pyranopterin monophosphate synthase n=1 Tax=Gekko japonicus TaxID=146911 RepID=A0ABM1LDA7_GEKJA
SASRSFPLLQDALQDRGTLNGGGHGHWLTPRASLSKPVGETFKKNVFTGHRALPGSLTARQLAVGILQAQLSSNRILQKNLGSVLDTKCLRTGISPSKQKSHKMRGVHSSVRNQPGEKGSRSPSTAKLLGASDCLTHIDQEGRASMVDIGGKADSERTAVASAVVHLGKKVFELVRQNQMKKGDVLAVAQIAGIQGAKLTSQLIPLCHNIPLSLVDISLSLDESRHAVVIRALCRTYGKTGVEMEALTAASLAALTVYDMCKAVTHDMVIGEVKLLSKEGGQRGNFQQS